MGLLVCPECGGAVSDRAVACPHCGFPHPGAPPPARIAPPPRIPDRPDETARLPAWRLALASAGAIVTGLLSVASHFAGLPDELTPGVLAGAAGDLGIQVYFLSTLGRLVRARSGNSGIGKAARLQIVAACFLTLEYVGAASAGVFRDMKSLADLGRSDRAGVLLVVGLLLICLAAQIATMLLLGFRLARGPDLYGLEKAAGWSEFVSGVLSVLCLALPAMAVSVFSSFMLAAIFWRARKDPLVVVD